MSNEHDRPTASTTQPGPTLLEERTLSGIFVHLLGVGTGFVLPALVYLVAEHDFTRENARNAFNWQVIVTGVFATVFGFLGGGIAIDSLVSDGSPLQPVATAFVLAFAAVSFGLTVVVLVNLAFGLTATAKAIRGTAWTYPLAPDVVGWLSSQIGGDVDWRKLLAAHVVVTPLTGAFLASLALGFRADGGPPFVVDFGLVLALLLTSVLTPGVLVRDMRTVAETSDSWHPSWLTYVGGPAGIAVLTYAVAAVRFGSENPAGDAVYGFAGALWFAVLIYLYRRHRRVSPS